jgi:hypothetical protein
MLALKSTDQVFTMYSQANAAPLGRVLALSSEFAILWELNSFDVGSRVLRVGKSGMFFDLFNIARISQIEKRFIRDAMITPSPDLACVFLGRVAGVTLFYPPYRAAYASAYHASLRVAASHYVAFVFLSSALGLNGNPFPGERRNPLPDFLPEITRLLAHADPTVQLAATDACITAIGTFSRAQAHAAVNAALGCHLFLLAIAAGSIPTSQLLSLFQFLRERSESDHCSASLAMFILIILPDV